jgi:signal transduction histidine kinase
MRNSPGASAAGASQHVRVIPTRDRRKPTTEIASTEVLLTLTHEIRGPLMAIRGWVSLMQTGHLPSHQFPRALQIIAENASQLSSLVDDVQDLSLITAGDIAPSTASCDLRSVVNTVIDSVRPEAEHGHVRLSTFHQGGPLLLRIDPGRLDQIVRNLVRNAVKFTGAGGRVEVVTAVSRGMARLMVTDTGVGISQEQLETIFEPFRQGASSNGTRTGLGLGLAIVRQLVHRHGGQVRAVSAGVGRGSTFVVTLPLEGGMDRDDAV